MALRQKKRGTTLLAVLLSGFCIVLIAAGVFFFLRAGGSGGGEDGIRKEFQVVGLDPAAKTGTLPGAPRGEKASGSDVFSYRINASPVFEQDGTGGKISLQNPAYNSYLMVLELCDQDENVLYRSQYIAPNQYIEAISLNAVPAAGEHAGTAYINVVDPATMKLAGILECPLNLTIK